MPTRMRIIVRWGAIVALPVLSACAVAPGQVGAPDTNTSTSYTLPGLFVAFGTSSSRSDQKYDAANPAALTAAVVADFGAAIAFCDAIDGAEYTVDCLSERLDVIAEKLPETGEFAEMRGIIADASQQLGAIAGQNPSTTLPARVISSTGTAPVSTTRPLRPVAADSLAANLAAADAVIAQAQVTLLRSTSNSQERAISYQQVAAIVGRSRTLLRSA